MKTNKLKIKLTATLLVITLFAAPLANSASYLFGLSPNYAPHDRPMVLSHLLKFTLETANPGDEIAIYDALNRRPITQFSIPRGSVLQNNARFRATRLAGNIAHYKTFLGASPPYNAMLQAAINLPEFLDLVGPQLRKPGQPLQVILVGSPFYLSTNNASFNMHDAFPTDAHLLVDQSVSVFGTATRPRSLQGVTVHYAYLRESFINDFHRERIMRFYSLFLQQQGGVLGSFAPDVSLAFHRAAAGINDSIVTASIDRSSAKVEMRHIPTRTVVHQLPQTTSGRAIQITGETLQATPFPIQTESSKIGIGIMWAAPVDCDLYVQPEPGAPELFFGNSVTAAGRYFHDYRGPNMNLDYEFVELQPTDLRGTKAHVNLFSGSASNVVGIVSVQYRGQSYRGEFRISATVGNEGRARATRHSSPHWTEIDLGRIVGLNPMH